MAEINESTIICPEHIVRKEMTEYAQKYQEGPMIPEVFRTLFNAGWKYASDNCATKHEGKCPSDDILKEQALAKPIDAPVREHDQVGYFRSGVVSYLMSAHRA